MDQKNHARVRFGSWLGVMLIGLSTVTLIAAAGPGMAQESDAPAQLPAGDVAESADVDPGLFNQLFPEVPANVAPTAAPTQPLPFSHQWHAGELGLDCATCHTNSDPGRLMTFPATETCMQCRSDVATDKEPIKKLTNITTLMRRCRGCASTRFCPASTGAFAPI